MFRKCLKDTVKTMVIGLLAGGALLVVLTLLGALFRGFSLRLGLETARSGMLIAGALGLFLLAGSNLYKRGQYELKNQDAWKAQFAVFSYKVVIGGISVMILLTAMVVDYFLYYR